jgi:glycosyltransferase involved in cell wall biosynthesis
LGLGLPDDFDDAAGSGIKKYSYELFRNLSDRSINRVAEITKLKTTIPTNVFGFVPSFMLQNSLRYFGDFDIVHSLGQRPFIPLNRGKAKIIATAHDFLPLLDQSLVTLDVGPGLKNSLYGRLSQLGMSQILGFDYISADSIQTRAEAIELGFDPKKVFVINIGLDAKYSKSIKKSKAEVAMFVVGYVGSFTGHKNVEFAIKAAKHVGRNVEFNLWGNCGKERQRLTVLSGSNKRVKFMGFAPDDKIVQIYDSFDAFVFPSLYEGFGLPILEAQARGLPVIIYKNGRISGEVRKYCFEAEDEAHMAQIIENLRENGYNEKRRKMAMAYAGSFTWKKCAKETLKLYQRAMQ